MKWFCGLVTALAALVSPHISAGASLSISGTYADKIGVSDGEYFLYPTGSSVINATLPIYDFDVSTLSGTSIFDLLIGDASIFGGQQYLGESSEYVEGKRKATWIDTQGAARLTLTWTTNSLTISGTAKFDAFGIGEMFDGTEGKFANLPLTVTVQLGDYSINRDAYVSGSSTSSVNGDFSLKNISLSGAADMTPPTVKLLSPKAGVVITNIPMLWAQASGNKGVSGVEFFVTNQPRLNGNEQFAPMTATADGYFAPLASRFFGTNFIFVFAVDNSGNRSTVVMRSIYYQLKEEIRIFTSGLGTVKGVADHAKLDLGSMHVATAVPQPGQVLAYWEAEDYEATYYGYQKNFTFWMEPEATITAHFVPNPFPSVKGNYNGVFFDNEGGVNPTNTGVFSISITTNGAYSGKLTTLTGALPFSGQLELDQDFTNYAYAVFTIKRPKIGDWHGQIAFDLSGAGQVSGSLSRYFDNGVDGSQSVVDAQFDGELLQTTTRSANQGVYNLALPPSASAADGPIGISYGTATIDAKAGAKLTLNLADQLPVTVINSAQGVDGAIPVFAPLYANKGAIVGWITIINGAILGGDINLVWVKPPMVSKAYYTNGFSLPLTSKGSLWVAPKAGTNLVEWTSGTLSFTMADGASYSSAVATAGRLFTIAVPAELKSASTTINPTTGTMTGSFTPKGSKSLNYSGIFIPGIGAKGYFLGTNASGAVVLQGY